MCIDDAHRAGQPWESIFEDAVMAVFYVELAIYIIAPFLCVNHDVKIGLLDFGEVGVSHAFQCQSVSKLSCGQECPIAPV